MKYLLIPAFFVVSAGLVVLSSISSHLFVQQLIWFIIGSFAILLFSRLDLRPILNSKWLVWGLYALSIFLLLFAYVTAPIIRNTRSWIVLGPFTFQPVELAKIALILLFAQFFSKRHITVARWSNILKSLVLFAIPAGLVLMQPDMGSASVLFGIWFGFLLVSGLPLKRILFAVFLFAFMGLVGWHFVLKPYQKERIAGVFYPEKNSLTINYSVIQAKIAIGSAGLFGKGYKQGSQVQLGYLTEPANDFVLASLIEEWGLLIGILVIGAFAYLILKILQVGMTTNQNFEKFVCLGSAIAFLLHFLINAGSTIGIFPVVGVTFPLLSYGGSSLLTDLFLLAIINGIARRS